MCWVYTLNVSNKKCISYWMFLLYLSVLLNDMNQDWINTQQHSSIVGIATRLHTTQSVVQTPVGARDFSFQDWLWVPTNLLFSGNHHFFPPWLSRQVMKLTTHLHLLPRLRMTGAVPLLPLYPSMAWTGKTLSFITLCLKFNITTGTKFFMTPCT